MTKFNISGNKFYLSPIIDPYNGKIINHALSGMPVFALVVNMLKKGFRKIKNTENLIIHSDQGWQNQMKAYQNLLKEKGIFQSMSQKGNYLDNAVIENFFGTLSTLRNLKPLMSSRKNRIRLNLKGKSPVQYRTLSADNIV